MRHTLWNRLGGRPWPACAGRWARRVRARSPGRLPRRARAFCPRRHRRRRHRGREPLAQASVRRRVIRTKRCSAVASAHGIRAGGSCPHPLAHAGALLSSAQSTACSAKEPGAVGAEFATAFGVAFTGIRVAQARRTIAGTASSAGRPSRPCGSRSRRCAAPAPSSVRAAFVGVRGERRDLNFLAGGRCLDCTCDGRARPRALCPAPAHRRSRAAHPPLSDSVAQLWQNAGYGWRDIIMASSARPISSPPFSPCSGR